ncbi:protein_kinase_-_putative [Leishmania major strain Friedlin]|nr:protein_kinase_-_putative [Leishmania major strain Friedlin]
MGSSRRLACRHSVGIGTASPFSVNGSGSVLSPCHPSGHSTPTAAPPAPARVFTVAVSEVPGEQLQSSGTAPSATGPVASPLDLAGGTATKTCLSVLLPTWMGGGQKGLPWTLLSTSGAARTLVSQCGRG